MALLVRCENRTHVLFHVQREHGVCLFRLCAHVHYKTYLTPTRLLHVNVYTLMQRHFMLPQTKAARPARTAPLRRKPECGTKGDVALWKRTAADFMVRK